MRPKVLFVAILLLAVAAPLQAAPDLKKLLLSGPWCSFAYNQTTGYSNSSRVVFRADGSYQAGSRAEGYSSGAGGSLASEEEATTRGRWQVKKGMLFLAEEGGDMEEVAVQIKRNSQGKPVLVADGEEYVRCR